MKSELNKVDALWNKWVDVQLGDWRDVSHSESFYAGYEAAEGEITELREKLVDVREKLADIEESFNMRDRHVAAHMLGVLSLTQKALAIIDGENK